MAFAQPPREPERTTEARGAAYGAGPPFLDGADAREAARVLGRRTQPALAPSTGSEAQTRGLIDTIPTPAWWSLPDGSRRYFNKRWHDYTGLTPEETQGWRWMAAVHPDEQATVMNGWRELVASGAAGELELRLRRFDGEFHWFRSRVDSLRDAQGTVVGWCGTETDVDDLRRTQSLRAAERRTLEMIAGGATLEDILNELCRIIDAHAPGEISSILLTEPGGARLKHAAGPRVPRAWLQAIGARPIGPREGCSGAAAYSKRRVVVADVATDPVWPEQFRELALRSGVRAAWAEPILTKEGELLGTFARYSPEPRMPTQGDLELVESAGHLAQIAISRQKSLEALRRSEAELRRITDAIPQCICVLAAEGQTLFANRELLEYTGVGPEGAPTPELYARMFHPDDVERLRTERQRGLCGGVPFELEQRLRRHDGTYRWFHFHFSPFRDEQGRVTRWYATGTDLEEQAPVVEQVRTESLVLGGEPVHGAMLEEIVGASRGLRQVLAEVTKVARTDSTVLIRGETGTGKELIARAIFERSRRAGGPFIRVNCAAISPSLVTSELFGHEKGAFTGAMQRRVGRFEAANRGTILLDEVGDLPMETQIALLRVLQEHELDRVGSSRPVSVDVRVVAATNRDLMASVRAGTFREDLYYRLNVFPLLIPPLRERKEDIPLLLRHFIEHFASRAGKTIRTIDRRTLELFSAYAWPGNVRELQNVVERAVILCDGETFAVDAWWLGQQTAEASGTPGSLSGTLVARERELIETALAASLGRISGPSGAASKLGIPRQTLDSRIQALHIDKHRFKVL